MRQLGLAALSLVVLGSCGGGRSRATGDPTTPELLKVKLCVDLDRQQELYLGRAGNGALTSQETAVWYDRMGVESGDLVPVWTRDATKAVVWTECTTTSCSGEVVLLDASGESVKRVSLPSAGEASPGSAKIDVHSASIDGDQLWIYYDLPGVPQLNVGRDVRSLLAILNLPSLTVALEADLGIRHGAAELASCVGNVARQDIDCDTHQDILVVTECAPAACLDDASSKACGGVRPKMTKAAWVERGEVYQRVR